MTQPLPASRRLHPFAGKRLTANEYVDMLLPPRIHLELLLTGEAINPWHLTSVVGVFNVATALAYMHHDRRAIRLYEAVSQLVLGISRAGFDQPGMRERLRKTFNIADDYLQQQTRPDLQRAVRLVEYQIRHGQATPLVLAPVAADALC